MPGVDISNEGDLFAIINNLASTKKKYDKIALGLDEVNFKGYGIQIFLEKACMNL